MENKKDTLTVDIENAEELSEVQQRQSEYITQILKKNNDDFVKSMEDMYSLGQADIIVSILLRDPHEIDIFQLQAQFREDIKKSPVLAEHVDILLKS